MSTRSRVVAAAVACSLAVAGVGAAVPALATPQEDLAEAQRNLDQVNADLADTQASLSEAQAKLDELASGLSEKQASLDEATTELEQTSADVQMTQVKVDETTQELAEKRATLSSRMRSNYKTGLAGLLDVFVNSTSFSDLLSRVYYLDKVSEEESAAIAEVQRLEDELSEQKAQLEQQQAEQEKAVSELESEVASYQDSVDEAQAYYDGLSSEVQEQLQRQAEAQETTSSLQTVVDAIELQEATKAAQAQQDASSNGATQPGSNSGTNTTGSNTSANSGSGSATNTNTSASSGSDSATNTNTNTSSGTGTTTSGGYTYADSWTDDPTVNAAVSLALAQVGKPYVYGAAGPNSFDCSGLVCYVYGWKYGHGTGYMIEGLRRAGKWKTSQSQLVYGDLVFPKYGHVGIYIGNGRMVHAANPSMGVVVTSVYAFYGGGSY